MGEFFSIEKPSFSGYNSEVKKLLKKLVPRFIFSWYYYLWAWGGAIIHRRPSRKMVVVGVTGTKGKTSAINFIWSALSAGGIKTGLISTANIRIGEKEYLNPYHMTMPGRFTIQNWMAQMARSGCRYCLVETTSEGIKQSRHIGIVYDIAVFTNLTPEHLSAHGGNFDKYKEAKGKLFKKLSSKHKKIDGQKIEKIIIANADDAHADYFLSFSADKKITYGIEKGADCLAENIKVKKDGVSFGLLGRQFNLGITGQFNVSNALPAIIIARLAGVPDDAISKGLENLKVIPGRMEEIDEGQDFRVFVDYAHEKEGMTKVLETAREIKEGGGQIVVLLGAEGGGRDKAKRPEMGEVSAKLADIVIVSNVDPYEDDPVPILEDIACACEKNGKIRDKNLFVIEDRRGGIKKALSLGKKGDIILITGKGAEQSIVIGGKRFPWDDRTVVREELGLVSW